jgi:anti-sigma regulatory factor (Ser/Thr protein kinase)
MSIQIVLMLPPVAASASLARHTLAEALRIARVAPDCIHEAEVALSEACTAVCHHAVAGRSLEVLVNIADPDLTMYVLDSGPGAGTHYLAEWPGVTSEGGGGLTLMTAFTDQVSFESEDEGESVRLTKRLRWNP